MKINIKLDGNCRVCMEAKIKSLPHSQTETRGKYKPGELIVGDYKLISESQLDGTDAGFFLFMDASTGFASVYKVNGKNENEQIECFIKFRKYLETQFDIRIRAFRHDRGKEYLNQKFIKYLEDNGIQDQRTAGYSPESNSIAESRFRSLDNMAVMLLYHGNLSRYFKSNAFLTAAYLYNRIPDSNGNIPLKAISGKNVDLGHLKLFGCKVTYLVPKEKRKQSDCPGRTFPGRPGRFIGYTSDPNAYLIWDAGVGKTIISRDVKFSNELYHDYGSVKDSEYARVEINDDEEHETTSRSQPQRNPEAYENSESSYDTAEESETIPTSADTTSSFQNLASNLGPAWTINDNSARALRRASREQIINMIDY